MGVWLFPPQTAFIIIIYYLILSNKKISFFSFFFWKGSVALQIDMVSYILHSKAVDTAAVRRSFKGLNCRLILIFFWRGSFAEAMLSLVRSHNLRTPVPRAIISPFSELLEHIVYLIHLHPAYIIYFCFTYLISCMTFISEDDFHAKSKQGLKLVLKKWVYSWKLCLMLSCESFLLGFLIGYFLNSLIDYRLWMYHRSMKDSGINSYLLWPEHQEIQANIFITSRLYIYM